MVDERTDKTERSRLDRLREQREWLDHLFRTKDRYNERYGNHYAAAITFFSVLSLVPLLMIAFAVGGFVLAGQPELLDRARQEIVDAVPDASLRDTLRRAVDQAVSQRYSVGIIGLAFALYAGLGWMSNLRDALTAQWGTPERPSPPFLRKQLADLLALVGLGLAMAVSFGLTAAATGFADHLLELLGLRGQTWAAVSFQVLSIALAVFANWVVFLWVLARLPREPVALRSAMRGALVAAVGFEALKIVGAVYLARVTATPSGAAFGSLLGLLVFAFLVARFLLYVTAWTATARENLRPEPIQPPPPAVIRPTVAVGARPDTRTAAGLLGAGALAGIALRSLLRRR
ncbi:inner membrane protein YhjD [Longimycelium tulufanense]|uniref:Inner membrane protein YhjD n=1 Tax=Longimycelium tulufanense TaxID=907463 RepID=A0A8J3C9B5_9PSEU|nr:inner membrane protein YhjD [Longimycelium tulufanense]GGM59381.1 inner membrane protein YhjD [Longimycelium tulufanense]